MLSYFEIMAKINAGRTKYGYESGISGLGYYDLLAQANLQTCNNGDSTCVANNVAKQAAVEDYWINNGMKSSDGVPDGTVLRFTPLTTNEITDFYNPANLFNGGNKVDDRNVLSVNNTPYLPSEYVQPPPTTVLSNIAKTLSAVLNTNPATQKTNTTNTTTTTQAVDSSDWFMESMFGGIPNWGLVVGTVLVGFMAMGRR